ncbi:MAG TPA: alpha/beta hydrolase-fold protein [Solirubrobacteraceae bacterium]|nr:alpha/beta hydrolase-fold protein [Solirubrobacteraceae bacterium]
MRRTTRRLLLIGLAAVIFAAGAAGAYSYGRDYSLHRGFSALVQLPRAGTGRLLQVSFYSPALHRQADYLAYLPPHYNPARRYPVVYLLHGMPGQPRVFVDIANMDVRLDNQLALGHARPMILVYPDGRIGGSTFSDSEWANTPSGGFESYVIEVMHNVDQRFSTLPYRQDRVIGGFSAGAYGAMNIALHHLADFGNVQSWSGYYLQTRSGVFASASRSTLAYNSPLRYVRRLGSALSRYPLRTFMFVGRDDSSSRQQLPMVHALQSQGVAVRYRFYPGGHDWSVWYPRLNAMLDLASWDVQHPFHPARRAGAPGAGPAPAAPALSGSTRAPSATPDAGAHRHRSELRLIGALLLSLFSAALINLGFVLQHRGQARVRERGRSGPLAAFGERWWLGGQAIGWVGFGGQILALALAPLTLVQAFAAGSLALSVPLAARLVGWRMNRAQLIPIIAIAVGLASLPVGYPGGHGHIHAGVLDALALLAVAGAYFGGRGRGPVVLAVGAGILYGVADAAIKADAVALHHAGPVGLLSGWTILAGLGTFAGFLAFQSALRDGEAVSSITLMTALTALTALVLGVAVFGEPIGSDPVVGALHVAAIFVVLACIRPLAQAQEAVIQQAQGSAGRAEDLEHLEGGVSEPGTGLFEGASAAGILRPGIWAKAVGAVLVAIPVGLLAVGLLYSLRQRQLLAVGPPVPDALPLLQLAGFSAQPLGRLLAASLLAGIAGGALLAGMTRLRRGVTVGLTATALLLITSDASFALAHNLRFGPILLSRAPGLGSWLEGLLVAAGAILVPRLAGPPNPAPVKRMRLDRSAGELRPPLLAGVAAGSLAAVIVAVTLLIGGGHARAEAHPAGIASAGPVRRVGGGQPGGAQAGAGRALAGAPGAGAAGRRLPSLSGWNPRPGWSILPRRLWLDQTAAQTWRSSGPEYPWSRRPPAGRLFAAYFYSPALHRMADYLVYLPPGYTPGRRLPVFYLLHGMPGRPTAYTANAGIESKLNALIHARRIAPMILVFPDGRIAGRTNTDSEWANTPSGRFESYVVNVVHSVDSHFATLRNRRDRAIAGLSAGAYGAANIALHQVALFGVLQVWSGYFTEARKGVFVRASPAIIRYNSPLDYVRTMRRVLRIDPLRAFLYIGRGDVNAAQTPRMAAAMRAAGVHVGYAIYPGGHSWGLWAQRLDQMLVIASRAFARR